MLFIFVLTVIDNPGGDEYVGFTVAAADEHAARQLAHDDACASRWIDPTQTTCLCVGVAGPGVSGVLLDSYNAG